MKRIVVITLVIAFFSVFVIPKQAKAGGASGAIVGAAIGAVVGLVAWAASSSAESPQKEDKLEKQGRLLEDKDITLKTWAGDLSSSGEKDNKKVVPIYSFRMVF